MIRLRIEKKEPNFQPGDAINGIVQWQDVVGRDAIEVRLAWFTKGTGNRNFETVAIHKISPIDATGSDPFQFIAPRRPQSFAGKLIRLQWALEAILFPDEIATRIPLTISYSGKEILLPLEPATNGKKSTKSITS